MKTYRLPARVSGPRLRRGLQAFLAAACMLALSACGGGSADPVAPAQASGRAVALAASPAAASVDLFQIPLPAGTTRVFQRALVNSSDPNDRSVAWRAEDMLAAFDAARVPVFVVACDRTSETGVDVAPTARPFVLVLDVRAEDLPFATGLGYAPLTAANAAGFTVVNEGQCASGRPGETGITPEQRIHGLARRNFGPLFSGAQVSGVYESYRYRYYTGTQNYLGLLGDSVYVHNGRDWNWQRVGEVSDFIPFIEGIPAAQFPAAVPAGATRMVKRSLVVWSEDPGLDVYYYGTFEWAENIVARFDALRLPINIVACDNFDSGAILPAIFSPVAMVLDVRDADLGYARSLGFVPLTAHRPVVMTLNPNACSLEGAPAITPARRIFGLSRRLHAQTFVGYPFRGEYPPYQYEYYSVTRNYLGVAGDGVYVHDGRDLNFQFVGTLRDFIPTLAGIALKPGP
jgi:hypothetical protein